MESKVRSFLEAHGMLSYGDTVVVALSGGADSVCLLHVLLSLREECALTLHACHINHMLRGADGDADEDFVRALCARLQLPLTVCRADVRALAKERGMGLEACGRAVRYAEFARVADSLPGAVKIATAHTLSDQAETVLMRLARGASLRGLCGIPPVRGRIIRPLLFCTRSEVEAYLNHRNFTFVTDASNASSDYTRNRIRNAVIPAFESENPSFARSILRMTDTLREDQRCLEELAHEAFARAKRGEHALLVSILPSAHAIRSRCIRLLLEGAKVEASSSKIAGMLAIIEAKNGKLKVAPGIYAIYSRGILSLQESARVRSSNASYQFPLAAGEISLPDGRRLEIRAVSVKEGTEQDKIHKNFPYPLIDYAKIVGNAVIRSREPGDRFRLPGRDFTSSVRKLLAAHFPTGERAERFVLADEEGVFFVEGYPPAKRVAPCADTERLLLLRQIR